jgi:hypothetical protein
MKKLIHSVIISTFALAGATQFIGCGEATPEDPPEAAEEEVEEESEGGPEGEGE